MITCACCGQTKPEKYSSGTCSSCYANAHARTDKCAGCGQIAKMQGGGLCRRCYLAQPHVREAKNRARREKYNSDPAYNERVKRQRNTSANSAGGVVSAKRRNRLWYYGLTNDRFEALKAHQGNKCSVCTTELDETTKSGLAVDHCHTTGKVRGLLCGSCNWALGLLKDNTDNLARAIAYLESPPADKV